MSLYLDGQQAHLKQLRINVRQELAGEDMSGQSSMTTQAETGSKAKILAVSGIIAFANADLLSQIASLAEANTNGARHIYRISNRTASALKIRQVKFQGPFRADEQENLRQWLVSFELVEHLSVQERIEQRQPEVPAAQQTAAGRTTASVPKSNEQPEVPPQTDVELTGFPGVLKKIDGMLA